MGRIEVADRVVVVGSPRYVSEYEDRDPERRYAVAAEDDLVRRRLTGTEAEKLTVLPVLREGTPASSFSLVLCGRVCADFRDDDAYFETVLNLVMSLYEIPPQSALSVELIEKFREV